MPPPLAATARFCARRPERGYRPREKVASGNPAPRSSGMAALPPMSATSSSRRLAWASYGTAAGLAVGTVIALATGADVVAALGAAVGAIAGVVIGRWRERRA